MKILQYLINGISIGSVYAIIALGYTMVYGIAKMLNFAHGDIIMIGAYISFCVTNYLGLSSAVSIIAAMVVCTILGIVIEALAYRPLRGVPSLAVLITAIGVSYFLQNAAQLIWSPNPKNFTSIVTFAPITLFDGQLVITGEVIITILASVLIMVCLTLFTEKARMGKAMRAVSEDNDAAQLMGINVNRTISMTFAIGSALAAVAGVLLCSTVPSLQPTTGSMPGIRAFTAAVFGGIGSIPGAMLGGILLGIIESLSKAYLPSQFSDAIVFGVLILVLLIKPTGLLGKKVQEKV
jgi:branched-chain amino acid transport system permease protein